MQRKNKGAVALPPPLPSAPSSSTCTLQAARLPAPTPLSPAQQLRLDLGYQSIAHSHQLPTEFPFAATTHDGLTPSVMQILRVNCKVQRRLSQSSVWFGSSDYQISFVGASSSHLQQLSHRSSVEGTTLETFLAPLWVVAFRSRYTDTAQGIGSGWQSFDMATCNLCPAPAVSA